MILVGAAFLHVYILDNYWHYCLYIPYEHSGGTHTLFLSILTFFSFVSIGTSFLGEDFGVSTIFLFLASVTTDTKWQTKTRYTMWVCSLIPSTQIRRPGYEASGHVPSPDILPVLCCMYSATYNMTTVVCCGDTSASAYQPACPLRYTKLPPNTVTALKISYITSKTARIGWIRKLKSYGAIKWKAHACIVQRMHIRH